MTVNMIRIRFSRISARPSGTMAPAESDFAAASHETVDRASGRNCQWATHSTLNRAEVDREIATLTVTSHQTVIRTLAAEVGQKVAP